MFNNIYAQSDDTEGFWNELEVNYGSISENHNLASGSDIRYIISKLNEKEADELACLINNKESLDADIDSKEYLIKQDINDIIFINAFVKRKKQSIDEFYQYKYNNADNIFLSSPLVETYHIYCDNREDLFQIKTLYEWNSKGTGYELKSDKKLSDWSSVDNLLTTEESEDEFTEYLYDKSKDNKKYKIVAYCRMDENNIIFMLYKLHKDSQQPDFDRSKRVKDIEKILFKIGKDNGTIHIKSKSNIDMLNIKKYFEEKLKCDFQILEEDVFNDYKEEEFKGIFSSLDIKKNPLLSKFQIDKIVFSESLLDKSPEMTLSLNKKDIWPAVVSAVNSHVISIESLSTIRTLNINYNNISRNIRSFRTEDGSIIFKLDDKALDKAVKEEIYNKFYLYFGIPLNRKINDKLNGGQANAVDLILRVSDKEKVSDINKSILESLEKNKIIECKKKKKYICSNEGCCEEISIPIEEFTKCPVCGEDSYTEREECETNIDKKEIIKIIKNIVKDGLKIDEVKESKIKIKNKELYFYRFEYNKIRYQIFITNSIINKNILKEIEKQLIPTIIIYYGIDNDSIKSILPNTMEAIQFGILYVNKDNSELVNKYLTDIINNLNHRRQVHVVSAATYANENLRTILNKEPNEIEGKYTDKDLENDTAAILKDLFYNSSKWGHENTGEAIPEGVIAIQYVEVDGVEFKEKKYAFSYDCKLTKKNEGYDLSKSEQRKARDYVTDINKTPQIKSFCSNKQLSGHLFIGNRFKESQIENMIKDFYEELPGTYTTKPVFIEIDSLLALHDWYRKNFENIKLNMSQFYEYLYKVLTNDNNRVTKKELEELYENVEAFFKSNLDIDKIKTNITK